jgi:hypothetical protein
MGFVLLAAIGAGLADRLPMADAAAIERMAEALAAGDARVPSLSGAAARTVLAHGFAWVILYGMTSAWLLSAASLATFRRGRGKTRGAI